MDLFIPPGGQTKSWYVRVYVPIDLQGHFGKAIEFRRSMKTTDKVEAMARAGVFITARAGEFKKKRAEIAAKGEKPTPTSVVLDQNLIRSIISVRFTSLLLFDDECRDVRGEQNDQADMEAVPKEYMPSLISIIARRRGAPGYKAYVDGVLHIAKVQGHQIARDDGSIFVDTSHELALGNSILFKPASLRSQNCVSASANDALVYARCGGTFRVEQYNV